MFLLLGTLNWIDFPLNYVKLFFNLVAGKKGLLNKTSRKWKRPTLTCPPSSIVTLVLACVHTNVLCDTLVRNGLFIDVNRDADYAPTWMCTWTAVVTRVCRCFILLLSPRAGSTLHCSCRAHGCLMIPCRSLSNSQMWKHIFFHKPFVCYCLVDISVFGTFMQF